MLSTWSLFIDACHSGGVIRVGGASRDNDNVSGPLREQWTKSLKEHPSTTLTFLSASTSEKSWEDDDLRQGLFSYYLLEGLKGAADSDHDYTVTATEAYRYLADNVENISKRKFKPQTPVVVTTTNGNFPLAFIPHTNDINTKKALYQRFLENYKGDSDKQKTAYDIGNQYLRTYGSDNDAVVQFLQRWVGKYEIATLEFNCNKAVNETPATAFTACKPYIDANPENLKGYLLLIIAGRKNAEAKNESTNAEASSAARRALLLIEQGKTTNSWAPFTSQAEAVAGLNYFIGFFTLKNSPGEAAQYMLKAAQSNSSWKTEPRTFVLLANAYLDGEYKRLINEYKAKYEGKEITEEMKPKYEELLAKINAVTDRIIDAWARAIALSANKPEMQAWRDTLMKRLEDVYKQRHDGKVDGLNELVAGILSKPIMLPGQELPPAP